MLKLKRRFHSSVDYVAVDRINNNIINYRFLDVNTVIIFAYDSKLHRVFKKLRQLWFAITSTKINRS